MRASSGATNFAGQGTVQPMRFAAEQAALLVQSSYRMIQIKPRRRVLGLMSMLRRLRQPT